MGKPIVKLTNPYNSIALALLVIIIIFSCVVRYLHDHVKATEQKTAMLDEVLAAQSEGGDVGTIA